MKMGFQRDAIIIMACAFVSILYYQVYDPPVNSYSVSGHVQFATINFEDCLFSQRKCGNTHRKLIPPDRIYRNGHEYQVHATSLCKDVAFHVALLNYNDEMLWNVSSTVNKHGYQTIYLHKGKATGSYQSIEVYLDQYLDEDKMYACQTSDTDNPFIMWGVELVKK